MSRGGGKRPRLYPAIVSPKSRLLLAGFASLLVLACSISGRLTLTPTVPRTNTAILPTATAAATAEPSLVTATSQAASPTPFSPSATPTSSPKSSSTATRTPQPVQGTAAPLAQDAALLPEARGDLEALQDLTRYNISAEVDLEELTFSGQVSLVYTNTETATLDRLYFRLFPNGGKAYGDGSLTVRRAVQEGNLLGTNLSLDDSVLEVQLPAELQPGEQARLELDFTGKVPRNFGFSGYGIYNFADDVLALSGWFPLLAVYNDEGWNLDNVSGIGDSVFSDMAFFSVTLTVPQGTVVAGTGMEAGRESLDGWERIHYASGPARDFFVVMSPAFQVQSVTIDGTMVNSYHLPDDENDGLKALQAAADSVRTYNDLFGRYPYTELDVVEAPLNYAAGVEFPGVVLITRSIYTPPRYPVLSLVVAHEVAHQWWYHLVGNDVIDDPWMDEAMATYSSLLYSEEVDGILSFREGLGRYREEYTELLDRGRDDLVTNGLPYFESLDNPGIYGAVVYTKGALFFQAVREAIGDPAFFNALQSYFAAHRYGIAEPQDLLEAFEAAAGVSLDDLYQQWLYSARP
jgi:hypothetical protein